MGKQHLILVFSCVLAFVLSAALPPAAFCQAEPARTMGETTIAGQECRTLKDYFARFEQDKTKKVPGKEVKHILLQALPEAYKEAWAETLSREKVSLEGSAGMTVRVLYVEGRHDEKPIRALITFAILCRVNDVEPTAYDERLAALVIGRDEARLAIVEQEADRKGTQLVRILPEKEVHIGGKSLVGLNFSGSNDNMTAAGAPGLLKEERVNFYLFLDDDIKPAGSVLKGREERLGEGEGGVDEKSLYCGAIIFKKDMLGNIIGILSPYTVARNDKRIEKGMVRYDWDAARGTFVKK